MNHENKRRTVWAVNGIFSFLLSFFLYLAVLCLVFSQTILQEGFARKILAESRYVSLLSDEIRDEFIAYGGVGGFEESFWQEKFSHIVSEEMLEADAARQLHSLYTGTPSETNEELVHSSLYTTFLEEAVRRGTAIDADKESDLQSLAETCAEVYGEAVQIPFADRIGGLLVKAKTPLYAGLAVLVCLSVLCAGIMVWLNRRSGRFFYWFYGGLAGAALLSAVLPLVVLLSGKIGKIGIFSQAMYAFSTLLLTKTLYTFLLAAGILLLLAISLLAVQGIRRAGKRASLETESVPGR